MKLTKKIVSAAIAMSMSLGTSALFPMTADAAAINWDSYIEHCPDWMPKDFESAMNFRNTYGATKSEGDTICILKRVSDSGRMEADIRTFEQDSESKAEPEYESHIYRFDFKLPEPPDQSDAKAYANYLDEIERYKYTSIYDTGSVGFHYEALVILNNSASGFDVDISLSDTETDDYSSGITTYSFARTDNSELEETDIYCWLPDSVPEFDEYIKNNGNISFREGMLIYADYVNGSTGASLNIEQTGTGELQTIDTISPRKDYVMEPTGGGSCILNVYTGKAEGDVDITFTAGRRWDPEGSDHKELTASVHVYENMRVENNKKEIPEWIPQDFYSATSFSNKYGATFHMGDIICFVRYVEPKNIESYPVRFEGSAAENLKSCEILNKIYTNPDNEYKAYHVMAYNIPEDSELTVNYNYGKFKDYERTTSYYTYQKDSTGHITETDKYYWLPDCYEEFSNYYDKYGAFSIQDDYILYCTKLPADGSRDITSKQIGSGAVYEDHEETINRHYALPIVTNNPVTEYMYVIKMFKPSKPGVVKLTISEFSYGKDSKTEEKSAYFNISSDMHISNAEEKDLKTDISGDCNGDGAVGISDAVTLKNWLHGKGELPESGSADVNGDGTVDVFDLIAVKKKLVNTVKEEPKPVMVSIRENYAWSAYQEATVIDQYGTAYDFEYTERASGWLDAHDDILIMSEDNWYDKVIEIMNSGQGTAGYITDNAMAEINSFAAKTNDYIDDKMFNMGLMCDAGADSLYMIGTDADGKPVNKEIATFGDAVGWIEKPEVMNFIKKLSSYGIFGGNIVRILGYGEQLF